VSKIVRERLIEGIGDVYASKRFYIPDEFEDFNQEYEILKNKDQIITINEKARVIKNPSSLSNIAPDVRGIIDKNGNVYLSIKANCIHQTILDSLEDQGLIKVPDRWYQDLPTEFISIQRVGNTDIIAMGESNLVLDEYRDSFTEEQIDRAYLPIINKAKKLNPNLNIQFELIHEIRFKNLVKESLEPMNYIPSFEEISKAAPKEIQDYLRRCGNTPQSAHWHPEGDVLKHITIVYNRARKTGDINNAMAALFHDLGKADVTKESFTKPGAWPAHGHEFVSAKLVEKHKDWIQSMGANWEEVYEMVKEHMRVKKIYEMRPPKQEQLRSNKYFSKINNFSQFDDMSTLSDEELQ